MNEEILLNAEEVKELKEELISLYEITHHKTPLKDGSQTRLNRCLLKFTNSTTNKKKKEIKQ